jgi:hypothetical protein
LNALLPGVWPHNDRMMTAATMVDLFNHILPHFTLLLYLGKHDTTPPNPSLTTNQPPIQPNVLANIWPMRTF